MTAKFQKISIKKGATGAYAAFSIAAAIILIAILSQTSSAALTFQGRSCSGNSICDVIRECDASGCVSRFENCEACGTTTKICPNGVATAPKTCSDSGTPQCIAGNPVCSAGQGIADPHVILTFNVLDLNSTR